LLKADSTQYKNKKFAAKCQVNNRNNSKFSSANINKLSDRQILIVPRYQCLLEKNLPSLQFFQSRGQFMTMFPHEAISQEKLNEFYEGMLSAGESLLRIDELVAMLMQDNTPTLETMLVGHVYYHRFRSSEGAQWTEWCERP